MSLRRWRDNGWLHEHRSSRQEIQDLKAVADRDLADCQISTLSPDWRLGIAYNAALQMAKAALAASGYRAARDNHHFRTISSLELTIHAEPELVGTLDAFRKKRNAAEYDQAGAVSEREANEMVELAFRIRDLVLEWITRRHPDLKP